MKFYSFVLILLSSYTSHAADDCAAVDLNEGTVLSEMSVRDQGKTSTCYAQASALLLEFKERSAGRKSSLSPFDLALGYKSGLITVFNPLSKSYEVGMALSEGGALFEAAYDQGIATTECVEYEVEKFTKETDMTPAQFIKLLQEVKRSSSVFKTPEEEKASLSSNSFTCNHQPALDSVMKAGLWAKNTNEVLLQVLAPCTTRRKKIPRWPYENDYVSSMNSSDRLYKILNRALDHRLPAQAGLCAQILDEEKSYSPIKVNTRVNGTGVTDTCGGHAVVVVGRKKVGNECHYMIRNSWGKDWVSPIGLVCGCRLPNGTYYKDCSVLADQIKNGVLPASLNEQKEVLGCWVSKKDLDGNLRQASALL
jgi:hypothetical protein